MSEKIFKTTFLRFLLHKALDCKIEERVVLPAAADCNFRCHLLLCSCIYMTLGLVKCFDYLRDAINHSALQTPPQIDHLSPELSHAIISNISHTLLL